MAVLTTNINWLALVVGVVISYGLGGLWYSQKLFGTKWMRGVGIDPENAGGQPIPALLTQLLGTVLLAWTIAVAAANDALAVAVLIVLTAASLMAASGMFSLKSTYAICTESGFVLAMAVIMIAGHAVF